MSLKEKAETKLWKMLVKHFLQGLFYVVPTAVTVYIIFYLVTELDSLINLNIPGLGIVVLLVVITVIGYLGTNFFFSYFKPFDKAIENTPLIKIIYTSLKDLMSAFVGKKKQFKTPVLVKLGDAIEAERLGFITKSDLSDLGISDDKVAVYLPFSYAISGEVLIVPKKNVQIINAKSADIMKMIISGGVTKIETHEGDD